MTQKPSTTIGEHNPSPAVDTPQYRRVVAAAMVGSVIEYFDFILFATVAALLFGDLFFPSENEVASTLLALSTFAVGYLARPLGGLLFGSLGDKHGRKNVLIATFMLMAGSTVLIGVLPTYETIGVAAPIILVFLRIVQGIGIGGEYGGAMVMVTEHTDGTGRRGFYSGLTSSGLSLGGLLAAGVLAVLTRVLSEEQFETWGWRIPFLASSVLLVVGFYIRRRVDESPIMKSAMKNRRTVKRPLLDLIRSQPKLVLIALLVPTALNVPAQGVQVFTVRFTAENTNLEPSTLLSMIVIAGVFQMVAVILSAWWSDRVGRRLPIIIGAVAFTAWAFVYFPLLLSGSTLAAATAIAVASFLVGCIFGPMASFLTEAFSTAVRYSGLSFAYQLNVAIMAGLTPVVAVALVEVTGTWVSVSILFAAACAVTILALAMSTDNHKRTLADIEADSLVEPAVSNGSSQPAEL